MKAKPVIDFNKPIPQHLAIILDGNGRWAKKRLLPRNLGHAEGIERIGEIIDECQKLAIAYLTIFTFSTENWNRPAQEVDYIMNKALDIYKKYEKQKQSFNIRIIGERTNLSEEFLKAIDQINSRQGDFPFTLVIAFNYGGQKELVNVVKEIANDVVEGSLDIAEINETTIDNHLYTKDIPPVDFLIRTSGEERISNFLIWQLAYAEMYFPKTYWPDFDKKALHEAISVYQSRERRFGKVGEKNA